MDAIEAAEFGQDPIPALATASNRRWDNLGVVLSSTCAVHCFLLPFILAVFPALGVGFLDDDVFHPILAASVVIVGGVAFSRGYRAHRNRLVLVGATVGILLLGFASLNGMHHALPEAQERVVTLAGSTCVISAHLMNWRSLRRVRCQACPSEPSAQHE